MLLKDQSRSIQFEAFHVFKVSQWGQRWQKWIDPSIRYIFIINRVTRIESPSGVCSKPKQAATYRRYSHKQSGQASQVLGRIPHWKRCLIVLIIMIACEHGSCWRNEKLTQLTLTHRWRRAVQRGEGGPYPGNLSARRSAGYCCLRSINSPLTKHQDSILAQASFFL